MLIKAPLPPILLPEPEVLIKYGKLALALLKFAKKKANAKGREHKKYLNVHIPM